MSTCLICQKAVFDNCNIQDIILFKRIRHTLICDTCKTKEQLQYLVTQYIKKYDYLLAKQIGELLYSLFFNQKKATLYLTRASLYHNTPIIDEVAELLRHMSIPAYHIKPCKLFCLPLLTPELARKRPFKHIVILSVNGVLDEEYLHIKQLFKDVYLQHLTLSELINLL